jgi:hypothetical protein
MEHGTLDTPVEYLCTVAHAQARYLGLITDNENAWEVEDWRGRVKRFTVQGSAVKRFTVQQFNGSTVGKT